MARKSTKTVYEKINALENKITEMEKELKESKVQLNVLYKERDSLEMKKMFDYARENNLSIDEVLKAMNVYTLKKTHDGQKS